ncbi:MAG: hypothetical protein K2H76_04835, partial [Muribaculaceae bacterium]|nr:hypothetical protein [Muribaculaceae bacterium]
VTITDAVNTANYAVGNEVENFCFEGADVNEDNKITLADASGTITLLLDMPPMSAAEKVRAISRATDVETDMLVIDDFTSKIGDHLTIGVALNDSRDYVAMQADIKFPEGMANISVEATERTENHAVVTKHIADNTLRVIMFDLDNRTFTDSDKPLFNIKAAIKSACLEDIVVDNIIASDAKANEYLLTSTGGKNSELSGIYDVNSRNVIIFTEENEIKVTKAIGYEITVYAVDGTMIANVKAQSDIEPIRVEPGVYVVLAGNHVAKVAVK